MAMTFGSSVSLQADRLHLDFGGSKALSYQGCLTRAHPDIFRQYLLGW